MNLRELVAKLSLSVNPSGFKQADEFFGKLKKTMQSVQTVGGAVGLAFEVAQGAAARLGQAFAEMGEQATSLGRTASLVGTTTGELQGLEHAVSRVGVSGEGLKGTLTGLMAKMYDTTTGSVGAVMAFGRLGVSLRDAHGKFKPVTEVLDQALERLAKIKDPIMRFGKAAALGLSEYLPAIENGIAGFRALQQKVKDFSAQLSDDDLLSVKRYKAAIGDLKLVLDGLRNNALGPFYDLFAKVGEKVSRFVQADKGNALKDLRQGFNTFLQLEGPLSKLIETGYRLLPVLSLLARFIAGIANTVVLVVNGIVDLVAWLYKIPDAGNILILLGTAVFAAWFPMLALFAAIFLVAEDFIGFFTGKSSFIGRALDGLIKWLAQVEKSGGAFSKLAKAILDAFDYIASGRLLTDWNDLVGGIQLAWTNFFKWIDDKLNNSRLGQFAKLAAKIAYAPINFMATGGVAGAIYRHVRGGNTAAASPVQQYTTHMVGGMPVHVPLAPVTHKPGPASEGKIATVNATFNIDGAKDPKAVASEVFNKYDELSDDTLMSLNQSGTPQ